jgi:hypothetical protein
MEPGLRPFSAYHPVPNTRFEFISPLVAADILPHQWWRNQASLISRPLARKTAGKGVGDSKSRATFCIPLGSVQRSPTLRVNLRSAGPRWTRTTYLRVRSA